MSMRSIIFCALVLALGSPAALAAERPDQYFAIHGGSYDYEPGADGESGGDSGILRFRYGYELNKFLGMEAHFGFDPSHLIDSGADDDPHLREGALFGRINLPFEGVNVYGLAGAGRAGGDFGDGRNTGAGPAVGVGIDLYGSDYTAISVEYLQYRVDDEDSSDDAKYRVLTLGWKRHFDWPAFR
jgi:opacity protein-like surface antigen